MPSLATSMPTVATAAGGGVLAIAGSTAARAATTATARRTMRLAMGVLSDRRPLAFRPTRALVSSAPGPDRTAAHGLGSHSTSREVAANRQLHVRLGRCAPVIAPAGADTPPLKSVRRR